MAGQFAAGLVSIGANRGDINRKQRKFDNALRLRADDRASQQAQMGLSKYLSDQRREDERAKASRGGPTNTEAQPSSYGLPPKEEPKAVGIVKTVIAGNEAVQQARNPQAGAEHYGKALDEAAKSGNPMMTKLALAAMFSTTAGSSDPSSYTVKTEYDPKTRAEFTVGMLGDKVVSRNATGRTADKPNAEAFNAQTHQDRISKETLTLFGGKLDPMGSMSIPAGQEQKFARINSIAQGIGREVGKKFSPGEIAAAAFFVGEKLNVGMGAKDAQAQAGKEAEAKAGWLSTDASDFKDTGGSRDKFIAQRSQELASGDSDAALRTSVLQRLGVGVAPQAPSGAPNTNISIRRIDQPSPEATANAVKQMRDVAKTFDGGISSLPQEVIDRAQAAIDAGADPAEVAQQLQQAEQQLQLAEQPVEQPTTETA